MFKMININGIKIANIWERARSSSLSYSRINCIVDATSNKLQPENFITSGMAP
jgi:hypothetical protein